MVVVAGMLLRPVVPAGLPFGRDGQVVLMLIFALAFGLTHLAAAFWEKSGDWAILGFAPASWHPLRLGLALGAGLTTALGSAVVLRLMGAARLQDMPAGNWGRFAADVLVLVALATLVEALAFRGYLHGVIERNYGSWWAVGIGAVLFTLGHTWGRIGSPTNLVAILALGCVLGAVRVRSEGFAAAWMAHLGLAWAQGALLHSGQAGLDFGDVPGYRLVLGAPRLLSGAGWGIDGGLLAGVLFVVAAGFLMRGVPLKPPPLARP